MATWTEPLTTQWAKYAIAELELTHLGHVADAIGTPAPLGQVQDPLPLSFSLDFEPPFPLPSSSAFESASADI